MGVRAKTEDDAEAEAGLRRISWEEGVCVCAGVCVCVCVVVVVVVVVRQGSGGVVEMNEK